MCFQTPHLWELRYAVLWFRMKAITSWICCRLEFERFLKVVSFTIDATIQSLKEVILACLRLIRVFEGHRTYFQTDVVLILIIVTFHHFDVKKNDKFSVVWKYLKQHAEHCFSGEFQAFFDSSSLMYNVNLNLGKVGKLWDSTFLNWFNEDVMIYVHWTRFSSQKLICNFC